MADADLIPPVKTKTVNDDFAAHVRRGAATPGLDYNTPVGTPVWASERGRVIKASNNPNSGAGKHVEIRHPGGFYTVYYHLSEVNVKPLQRVQQHDIIGKTGNTGTQTTGPHLHFAIKLNGRFVDPARVFLKEKRERRREKREALVVETMTPTHEIIPE